MPYTASDYISKINLVKTGYLDGKWNATDGQYESDEGYGIIAYTWLNSFMAQTITLLAAQGVASSTDIARAKAVVQKLIAPPCYNGGTWTHFMDGTGDKHAAVDQVVAECLYFAWKYRAQLGLSTDEAASIVTILTVDVVMPDNINDIAAPYHSLDMVNCYSNQSTGKWKLNRLTYAVLAGGASWATSLSTCVKRFAQYIDTNNPGNSATNLFADFGWRYIPLGEDFPSAEYGQMTLGGMLIYLPEIWDYLSLTSTEIAKLKAWQRHLVGQWQADGYLNWDTMWSSGRIHYLSYWMWSLRSLSGMVRGSNLLMNSADSGYAKYLLDQAIDTFFSMDTLRSDFSDNAVPSYYFGVADHTITGDVYNNVKSSSNAKFIMELAMAVELGVAGSTSAAPSSLWSWGWANKHVHVSTPSYSAASLPKAPTEPDGWAGMDAVQLQHWGVSHIQVPRNKWLTGFGGYGLEAFSFRIKKDGVTEVDTSATVPSVQNVYVDGDLQARTSYDTSQHDTSFASSVRSFCQGNGSNYQAQVDTTFYLDHIDCTHQAILTGTAGSGQVIISIPARKNCVMDYWSAAGGKTTVWNGTTVVAAGSPDPTSCKYIHLKWAGLGAGILLIPKSGTVAAGAKVTALAYTPGSAYPKRQPDQDRSLLIYLADSAAAMSSVSLSYGIYFTDGTDSGAASIYSAVADTAAPTVTFTLPSTYNSLTVPVTTLTATDDVGVVGYIPTIDDATPPAATDSRKVSSAPTSITFPSVGTHTARMYAVDAAGNVSAGVSATTIITLPPPSTTSRQDLAGANLVPATDWQGSSLPSATNWQGTAL